MSPKIKPLSEYFVSWDGWICEVEDENGCPCGFVVGCDSGDMLEHLKDEHNIKAENEF